MRKMHITSPPCLVLAFERAAMCMLLAGGKLRTLWGGWVVGWMGGGEDGRMGEDGRGWERMGGQEGVGGGWEEGGRMGGGGRVGRWERVECVECVEYERGWR
jgi:hypothetical protein